ncbi:MAG: hypothetical protein U0802_19470 [Candidatus Binatia bacterium]
MAAPTETPRPTETSLAVRHCQRDGADRHRILIAERQHDGDRITHPEPDEPAAADGDRQRDAVGDSVRHVHPVGRGERNGHGRAVRRDCRGDGAVTVDDLVRAPSPSRSGHCRRPSALPPTPTATVRSRSRTWSSPSGARSTAAGPARDAALARRFLIRAHNRRSMRFRCR